MILPHCILTTLNRSIFYCNLRISAAADVAFTTLGGDRVQMRKEMPKASEQQDWKEQAKPQHKA